MIIMTWYDVMYQDQSEKSTLLDNIQEQYPIDNSVELG